MKRSAIIMCFMSIVALTQAQKVDTIRMGYSFKNFKNLELGTVTDLVYNEAGGRLNMSIKKRTTELVSIEGRDLVRITHEWNSPNEQWSGSFEYYCEPNTLKPVQHIRKTKLVGTEGFQFSANEISGLDSVRENKQKDFKLQIDEPTYNWEIDLETYSLIPMNEGKKVVMNFYHPGGKAPPAFYTLEVIGSDKIELPNGKFLDCWIVFTDYNGTQPTRFWYTKEKQRFIKMEGQFNQVKIRKVRLYE